MSLFAKERTIPPRIVGLEALHSRLPKKHRRRAVVEADLENARAGFAGEQTLDFFLKPLPSRDYRILSDLRLIIDQSAFQMDSLLFTPSQPLIAEVKNLAGTIIYDAANKQFIQVKDGERKRIENPMAQVFRQQFLLGKWLDHHRYSPAPIECLVVNSNRKTILRTEPENHEVFKRIIHVENVLEHILTMTSELQKIYYEPAELKKLIRKLITSHTPPEFNLLKKYGVSAGELIKGVQCPSCRRFGMLREYGAWSCKYCKTRSKTAHIPAIDHYLLLISPQITNRACRDFLIVPSRFTAHRILISMGFTPSGKGKNCTYRRLK